MKTKDLVYIALMAVCIGLIAPLSIPVGEIPISLATFMVMVAGIWLGWKKGCIAVALYILLGCIGLPFFAGYKSGFAVLFGTTGGYIIGYIALAFFAGLKVNKSWMRIVNMVIGTFILYVIGTIWFMILTKMNLMTSLLYCVIPFLLGDALKIVLAYLLTFKLKNIQ
ncbi:MAG: biotin transporter BioY [Floccifex sp.]